MNETKFISIEKSRRNVLIMAERVAALYYHTARNLTAELGDEKAAGLKKKIIEDYGNEIGAAARAKVEGMGLECTAENYAKAGDLPTLGWEAGALDCADAELTEIRYCPFAEYWKAKGFEKWGRIYCGVDQAKYQGYNNELCCEHVNNTLDGSGGACVIRVSEKNRGE